MSPRRKREEKSQEQLELIEKAKERCGERDQGLIDSIVHRWDWADETEDPSVYPRLLERVIEDGPHKVLVSAFSELKQGDADDVLIAMWHVLRNDESLENLAGDLLFSDQETERHFAIELLHEHVGQHRAKKEVLTRALDSDDEYVRDFAAVQLAVFVQDFSPKLTKILWSAIRCKKIDVRLRMHAGDEFFLQGVLDLERLCGVEPDQSVRLWAAGRLPYRPTNRAKAQHGVESLYRSIGLDAPKMLWLDCPLKAVMCAAYLYALQESLKGAEPCYLSKKRPSLFVSSHFSFDASVLCLGLNRLRERGEFSMADVTSLFMRNQLRDDIRCILDRSYAAEHSSASNLNCDSSEYIQQCVDTLTPFLEPAEAKFLLDLPKELKPQDGPVVWWTHGTFAHFVSECIDLAVESQLKDWLQLLKYLGTLGIDVKSYDGLEDIVYSTSMFWPFKNLCILVDSPVGISQDFQGRLHNESEKAYRFKSGWGIAAWHGVHVPHFALLPTETWSVQDIDHGNIEARRLMIERYGTARYLQDTNAELIHEDEWGQLYRKNLSYDEPLVMVRLTDKTAGPNGYRQYFLRVPPTMTTAKEAVAWSFGLSADEYSPLVET